jgi:hypothetical protein
VQFLTVIRQRWKRAFGASLTIALLSAVAVVGFTVFGSKMLTACKAAGNAEQALVSGSAFEGLLSFESPAATVAQHKAQTEESQKSIKQADVLLVKNWRYTQNPLADAFQTSWTSFFAAFYIWSFEEFLDTLTFLPPALQLQFDQLFTAWYDLAITVQRSSNALLPPAFRSPPIPPRASPYL